MNTPTPTQTQGGESATPRTDALLIDCLNSNRFRVEHMADFARQLERETATLHAQLGEARAELLTTHQMACRVGLERDELRAKQGEAP